MQGVARGTSYLKTCMQRAILMPTLCWPHLNINVKLHNLDLPVDAPIACLIAFMQKRSGQALLPGNEWIDRLYQICHVLIKDWTPDEVLTSVRSH